MKHRHANISFFIPHVGCPQTCSFCDQRAISGVIKPLDPEEVSRVCKAQLKSNGALQPEHTEIAFFGGSFTAIDKSYMVALLKAAFPFVERKLVRGIRISTRPDFIDKETLALLKGYGVTAIELGAQSTGEQVLAMNNRGHTKEDIIKASKLIKEFGFSLGLQMMVGLPGDNEELSLQTAQDFVNLKPETVRIYPTLVLENTQLHIWFLNGQYRPLSLKEAVKISAKALTLFEKEGIHVIKLGLHPDREMQSKLVAAGPFHPAFRQLVESFLYLEEMHKLFENKSKGEYTVLVNRGQVSNCVGNKGENLRKLRELGYFVKVRESEKTLVKRCVLL